MKKRTVYMLEQNGTHPLMFGSKRSAAGYKMGHGLIHAHIVRITMETNKKTR